MASLYLFSCTKNNTEDEPIVPNAKKLVKALGWVENGDTALAMFFEYRNDKLIKYSFTDGEAYDYHGYSFTRDANDIITGFTILDSVQYDGVLHSVTMEHWKPFYDKTQRRYTYAIRTYERYFAYDDWVLEEDDRWQIDSIAYQYTGDKIAQIEYYRKPVSPDDELNLFYDYRLHGKMELQRDGKGRIVQLLHTWIPEYGETTIEDDSKFEYDETLNPLYFGDEGIFLIEEYSLLNFHSENNYQKHHYDVEKIKSNFEYEFNETGYPTTAKFHSIWPDGSITQDTMFYFYE